MAKTMAEKVAGTAKAIGMKVASQAELDAAREAASPLANDIYAAEDPGADEAAGWVSKGLPQIVKIGKMELGRPIIGEIEKFVASTRKDIKNPLMYLKLASGKRIAFPVTAVVAGAVGQTPEEQETLIGYTIRIVRTGESNKVKGKNAAHLFDIALKAPAATGKKK